MHMKHFPKLTICWAIEQVSMNSIEFEVFIVMAFDYSRVKLKK